MVNNQMTNYIVATAQDLPRIRVFFEENNPYALGPGGAKGLGELPMDGPAPAVLAAVQNALGLGRAARGAPDPGAAPGSGGGPSHGDPRMPARR